MGQMARSLFQKLRGQSSERYSTEMYLDLPTIKRGRALRECGGKMVKKE